MAYTTIDDPGLFFKTVLYTGTAATNSITGVGFTPDFVWFKGRSTGISHQLYDTVRGNASALVSSSDAAAIDATGDGFTSLDADGYTFNSSGGGGNVNGSGTAYVAWNWKGGTTAVPSGGTITPSAVSFSAAAGFGIYKYAGTGSGATVAHGLGVAPVVVIIKNLGATANWAVYNNHIEASNGGVANTTWLVLNQNVASQSNDSGRWNATSPTSTTFSVGLSYDQNNKSGDDYIAYAFTPVQGYSKFGSYAGNGSTDGQFVYTGFRPAYIMVKRWSSTAAGWAIFDSKREGYNGDNEYLVAETDAGGGAGTYLDILSNGFKPLTSDGEWNDGSSKYVFMAFADSPLVNSEGIPTNAR